MEVKAASTSKRDPDGAVMMTNTVSRMIAINAADQQTAPKKQISNTLHFSRLNSVATRAKRLETKASAVPINRRKEEPSRVDLQSSPAIGYLFLTSNPRTKPRQKAAPMVW